MCSLLPSSHKRSSRGYQRVAIPTSPGAMRPQTRTLNLFYKSSSFASGTQPVTDVFVVADCFPQMSSAQTDRHVALSTVGWMRRTSEKFWEKNVLVFFIAIPASVYLFTFISVLVFLFGIMVSDVVEEGWYGSWNMWNVVHVQRMTLYITTWPLWSWYDGLFAAS